VSEHEEIRWDVPKPYRVGNVVPAAASDAVRAALERLVAWYDDAERLDESEDGGSFFDRPHALFEEGRAALRLPAAAPVDAERLAEAMKAVRSNKENIDLDGRFDLGLDEEAAEIAAILNRLAGQSSSQPVGGEDRGDV